MLWLSDQHLQIILELLEDLLLAHVLHSILTRGTPQAQAQPPILDQKQHCGTQRVGVLGRNNEAAAFHHHGDLSAFVSRSDYWAAAREHRTQPGRHHQIRGAGSLRKQVNVGCIQ